MTDGSNCRKVSKKRNVREPGKHRRTRDCGIKGNHFERSQEIGIAFLRRIKKRVHLHLMPALQELVRERKGLALRSAFHIKPPDDHSDFHIHAIITSLASFDKYNSI